MFPGLVKIVAHYVWVNEIKPSKSVYVVTALIIRSHLNADTKQATKWLSYHRYVQISILSFVLG